MLTYLNDQQLKADFLAEIGKHEKADQFVKGTYGKMNGQFRGCAIGCSLHSLNVLQQKADTFETDNHTRYEAELGLPTWLAYLEDNGPAQELLAADYAGMVNDGLLFEKPPLFAELVARCRAIQDRANNIGVSPPQ